MIHFLDILLYALHEMGVFNKGKSTITQITRHLEKTYSVKLGNTSKAFQQLLYRKMGYTSFLDKMKEGLLKRIDGIEEKHIR